MPVGRLVRQVADKHQANTQRSWKRPYGVGLLVAGYDQTGPHIYNTCPSGNFYEYKAMSIGARAQVGAGLLRCTRGAASHTEVPGLQRPPRVLAARAAAPHLCSIRTLSMHIAPNLAAIAPSPNLARSLAHARARTQAAKTYLEKNFEAFAPCSLDELIQHGLKALGGSLSDGELTAANTTVRGCGLPRARAHARAVCVRQPQRGGHVAPFGRTR